MYNNKLLFAIVSFTSRILQGLSIEIINILIFSLASFISESDKSSKNLSYMEMATSLGYVLGPFLCFSFRYLGYPVPFIIATIFDFILIYVLLYHLETNRSVLNKVCDSEDEFKEIDNSVIYNNNNSDSKNNRYYSYDNNNNDMNDKTQNVILSNTKEFQKRHVIKNYRLNIRSIKYYNRLLRAVKNSSKQVRNNFKEVCYPYYYYSKKRYNSFIPMDNQYQLDKYYNEEEEEEEDDDTDYIENFNNDKIRKETNEISNNNSYLNSSYITLSNVSIIHNSCINENNNYKEINLSNNPSNLLYLIFNKNIFWTFLAVIVDCTAQTFFNPVFTLVMFQNFKLSVNDSSIILSLMFLVYFLSLRFLNFVYDIFPAKFLLVFGLMTNSFSCLMLNPNYIFPNKLYISVLGYCFLNGFASLVTIPSLIDLSNCLKKQGYNDYVANDTASGIYILGINLAELFGPIIGGVVTNFFSFEFSSSIVGLINLIISILYFIAFRRMIKRSFRKNIKY